MLKKTMLATFAVLLLLGSVFAQDDAASDKPAKQATVAPTADTAKTTGRFTPTKTQIQAGQEYLKEKKLYNGETAGKYNEETRAAIRVFQKENGLPLTGNFNQATLGAMNIALTDKQKGVATATAVAPADGSGKTTKTASSSAKPAPVAKGDGASDPVSGTGVVTAEAPKRAAPFQATKDQIVALQNVLIKGKMFTGEANGERSDALKEAVKKYQEANGLKATGGINAVTLEKMNIPLTDKQKAQVTTAAPAAAAKSVD